MCVNTQVVNIGLGLVVGNPNGRIISGVYIRFEELPERILQTRLKIDKVKDDCGEPDCFWPSMCKLHLLHRNK